MKGKKILFYSLIIGLMSILSFCCVINVKGRTSSIKYAKAESIYGFSEKYEGDIIFSVEKVYFAEDNTIPLTYNLYEFEGIQNSNNETVYFGANQLFDDAGANNNKYVVKNGDYVIVDDMSSKYAKNEQNSDVMIREGIMVTLGGYYYESADSVATTTELTGAGLEALSFQVTRNGESLTKDSEPTPLVMPRTYNSKYYDIVWFIPAIGGNEGHYEMSIGFMKSGRDMLYRNFDFYYLFKSSYEEIEMVNDQNYTPMPTFEGVESTASAREYVSFLGNTNDEKDFGVIAYPMLTFDYSRYNVKYSYTSGGVERQYELEYDGDELLLHSTTYNVKTVRRYSIPLGVENTIASIMFADAGEYNFEYSYVYNYIEDGQVKRREIDNLSIEPMKLNIHGYQLKYSKTDSLGVDMKSLEIASNGTMFILVNGFTDTDSTDAISAGVNYRLVDSNQKTGTILSNTDAEINFGSIDKDLKNVTDDELKAVVGDDLKSGYQTTNQAGLWFTLNDEYNLNDSYYYYSTQPITTEFINSDNLKAFTKVTTFTKTGYYLVQVKYGYKNYKNEDSVATQWFAFRITSSTPKMNMYLTDSEEHSNNLIDVEDFYSHQYTNKNVFANWSNPNVFESKIIGTLYSSNSTNKYPTEEELRYVAYGGVNSNIKATPYTQNTIITGNGSYLLVLQLEKTVTKTYSYFTIDKEPISGLELYEVATNYLDGKAIYTIRRDENFKYVTHTSKALLDVDFTLGWADKKSGATISASYRFAPFVKTVVERDRAVTDIVGNSTRVYMLNDYVIGSMSQDITITKPGVLTSNLNVDRVLSNQGVYVFTLEDEAGNRLQYVVVVDRTEGYIDAWYEDDGGNINKYNSGDTVNNNVNLQWGTHKAINITGVSDDSIQTLIDGRAIEGYYQNSNSNIGSFSGIFNQIGGMTLLTVPNSKTELRLLQDQSDKVYIVTSGGEKLTQHPIGSVLQGWDSVASSLFTNVSDLGLIINIDKTQLRSYNINVIGANQVSAAMRSTFKVVITPDKAQGKVLSSSQEGDYSTVVWATASAPTYEGEELDENLRLFNYSQAQASDDGLFVFECVPDDTTFKVTEIKYNYYQLMSQDTLNKLSQADLNNYPFYPYTYVSSAYILKTENNVETISDYTKVPKNQNGRDVTVIRSNPINLGYETYYENGELISKKVTQTGLYIVTRKIQQDGESGQQEWSYAFFVDRNQIVSYSISSNNEKLVGEFIHANMTQDAIFENFAKQGLIVNDRNVYAGETISYKVYLETNKLPTQIKVPTGKYASGNANKELIKTSAENLKLKLSVYFYDYYGLLDGGNNAYRFIRLMHNVEALRDSNGNLIDASGYMVFSFKNSDNGGEVAMYRKAVVHNGGDGLLSLPGEYVFVISDTVGTQVDDLNRVTNPNVFTFGVRLTNVKPQTNVYAYANMNGYISDNKYSENNELYTNQEFVEFEIPKEVKGSYSAQLDFDNFDVYQINNGTRRLWLRKRNGQISSGGIITDNSVIIEDEDKYIVRLDSGLIVGVDGNIESYQEYTYQIVVQYILRNSGVEYYTYNTKSGVESFYSTTYTVYIDRTPNAGNLNNIVSSQKIYFEDYIGSVASEYNVQFSNLNVEKAYRSNLTTNDHYALINNMYYQLVEKEGVSTSAEGMYAISVNRDTKFDISELAQVYWKKLNFASNAGNEQKMGLLPICDTYFTNSSGYHIFSENLTTYRTCRQSGNTYWSIVAEDGELYTSGYYEIVEVDKAGNLTQYLVYFEPSIRDDVTLQVEGNDINNNSTIQYLQFKSIEDVDDVTFIGIKGVQINNIASDNKSYYMNIKIYDGRGIIVEDIYVDSTAKLNEINAAIKSVLVKDGNYTIQITDTYNSKKYVYINNYTNTNYQLSTSALIVKTDNSGNKYVKVGLANTQMNESANLYCYVSEISFKYDNTTVTYRGTINQGVFELAVEGENSNEVYLFGDDVIYLAEGKQYLVTLKDSFGKSDYYLILSTTENYQAYSIVPTKNYYQNNNITYTVGDVVINYNSDFYTASVMLYENDDEVDAGSRCEYGINSVKLLAYNPTSSNDAGGLRRFVVVLKLIGLEVGSYTYEVWIDTRFAVVSVTNQNLVDKSPNVLSSIALDKDYSMDELNDHKLYGELLTETVTVSWTKLNNNYFNYQYELIEFENSYTAKELDAKEDSYTIVPKEKTTGRYVLKATITDKNGQWIATRIFTINMSTSISGLYKVLEDDKEVEHSSITNLKEILLAFGIITSEYDRIMDISVTSQTSEIATELGFSSVEQMKEVFDGFGTSTAIPMYISVNHLLLHSNSDNGVKAEYYEYMGNTTIRLYNITRSDYRTFAVIMLVDNVGYSDIMSADTFALTTREGAEDKLLAKGNAFTKYDAEAQYYKLNFNSYNKNMSDTNLLEKHNKILIDIYYNGEFASRVVGGENALTNIEFKNSGTYTLYVRDVAGNVQHFGTGSSRTDYFTLTVMKAMLFSINGEAPIKYGYYNDKVTLTINNTNPSSNTYNYDFNSIELHAYLNNSMNEYKGYIRNSYTYTFTEYGTYLIKMSGKLLSTGETVRGDMVFTILNPNEVHAALDFTSICAYDIISVIDVTRTVEKDVTSRFLRLLSDKANQENVVYNKLITYERLVKEFGITQGKMKFKVIYEANDDKLLPARQAEFVFTINNEVPTIESSIGAGKKTTSPVTIKFNGAIIYSQMGECNLVVNDEVILRIDEKSKNEITQLQIKPAGKYYVKVVTDSGYVATSFNFTIKEKLNTISIVLIVIVSAIVIVLVGTFIWLRTRMKVR